MILNQICLPFHYTPKVHVREPRNVAFCFTPRSKELLLRSVVNHSEVQSTRSVTSCSTPKAHVRGTRSGVFYFIPRSKELLLRNVTSCSIPGMILPSYYLSFFSRHGFTKLLFIIHFHMYFYIHIYFILFILYIHIYFILFLFISRLSWNWTNFLVVMSNMLYLISYQSIIYLINKLNS